METFHSESRAGDMWDCDCEVGGPLDKAEPLYSFGASGSGLGATASRNGRRDTHRGFARTSNGYGISQRSTWSYQSELDSSYHR